VQNNAAQIQCWTNFTVHALSNTNAPLQIYKTIRVLKTSGQRRTQTQKDHFLRNKEKRTKKAADADKKNKDKAAADCQKNKERTVVPNQAKMAKESQMILDNAVNFKIVSVDPELNNFDNFEKSENINDF